MPRVNSTALSGSTARELTSVQFGVLCTPGGFHPDCGSFFKSQKQIALAEVYWAPPPLQIQRHRMQIGPHSTDDKVVIVAEIGNNHEGDSERALRMVEAAAAAGVDAVKLQTFVPELFVSADQESRLTTLRRFALPPKTYAELSRRARELGLAFLSTPLDLESVRFLEPLVDVFKVASSDNTFMRLLGAVAKTGKPIIVSGGLADLATLERSVKHIEDSWAKLGKQSDLAVLHCVSSYPTAAEDANISALKAMKKTLPLVGYSDHTLGTTACIMAVALDARIIEKHFTLDKQQSEFRDHQLSADPAEMSTLVALIREAEAMTGNGLKEPTAAEREIGPQIRRSCAAARDLMPGTEIVEGDIIWVRPGTGIEFGGESRLLGRRLVVGKRKGELFASADVA